MLKKIMLAVMLFGCAAIPATVSAGQPAGKGKDKATNEVFVVYVELLGGEEVILAENGPLVFVARCTDTSTPGAVSSDVYFSSTEGGWLAGGLTDTPRNAGEEWSPTQQAGSSASPRMNHVSVGAVSPSGHYIGWVGVIGAGIGGDICFEAGQVTISQAP